MTFRTAAARASGPRSAVRSMKLLTLWYCCAPSSGMSSGSSGASFASRSARSTVRRMAASSSTLVDAEARRRPTVLVTDRVVSVTPPDVVISLPAKRVLPLQPLPMLTRVSSAFATARARSARARASSRVMMWAPSGANRECGIRNSSPC
jgi:hypothetical protein